MNARSFTLPEGRPGQIAASACTLLAVLLVWLSVGAPAVNWYTSRAATLAQARLEVAHMRALQDSLPELRRLAAQTAAQPEADQTLVAGDSDAVAGANLQAELQGVASQTGASLDSVETLPAQQIGPLRRIGVAVSITTTWPQLIALMTAIDTQRPRMILSDLSVTADSAPDPRQDVSLQASFSLSAFWAGSHP
jgi:general secretion pathway protein M